MKFQKTVIGLIAVILAINAVGLGLIVGHCLDSWMLCCGGGGALAVLALCMLKGNG